MRLALALALTIAASVSAGQKPFRAGAFAQDVTPEKFPISVNGGFSDRKANGSHDRLHARCLVLDDGDTMLAFAVVDSCVTPRSIIESAKKLVADKTGIQPGNVLISATHTHTAPTVTAAFQSEPDSAYVVLLPKLIAAGIEKAHARLAPARIGWGVGSDSTQVFNRRWFMKKDAVAFDPFGRPEGVRMNPGHRNPGIDKPAGPVDPEISFLSVLHADGRPMALFANYSLHYVGGVEPLSADYFAGFADRIRDLLHADSEFVGIMSNGTSGNINNINFAEEPRKGVKPYEQIRLVSDSVARATLAAWKKIEHHDHAKLSAAVAEIQLRVRKPTANEISRAKEIVSKAKGPEMVGPVEVYARETIKIAEYPDFVPLSLQAFRVGEVGIAAVPCEVFVEIGLAIKEKSPRKPTFTVSLANGYNGYLPTPEHHKLGGYETWRARSSYLEVDASTKITAKVLELLAK